MQSKVAKIGFIVLIVLAGVGFLYLKKYGPESFSHKESKQKYESYTKVEATIMAQEGNGRIGKGQGTNWTIQYIDKDNKLHTVEIPDNSFAGKNNGEKIIIYYNPVKPDEVIDEKTYDEIMP
ncbi:hypothetical protein [Flavobacterium sp. '19STA2R22 D10 B1']|uniref:hypothetical protein n=1 Tax=Flavobacterium aerium TaxID=3037261 RepID=UPI00278C32F1|nr:hypothetical protein [Flavobacterium sp. '19STA2R22 D10 B1']